MGPNPIARSKYIKWLARMVQQAIAASQMIYVHLYMATSPSGKARVCKTLIMGSNPIVASSFNLHN